MTYKELLTKHVGKKAHFDLALEGFYYLDFSGVSYSNAELREAHDEFVIIYEEVEKRILVLPYSQLVIRLNMED